MKHSFFITLRSFMLVICMLGIAAEGQEIIQDDFTFRLDPITRTATCLNYFGSSEAPVMPAHIELDGDVYPVTFIYHWAFMSSGKFKTITLPETLKKIGETAFAGCSNLESIVIPNSVDTIMAFAFCRCTSLQRVKLSENMKVLPAGIFYDCESLEVIELPNSIERFSWCLPVESLEESPDFDFFYDPYFSYGTGCEFFNCQKLKTVILPNNLTHISDFAFDMCSSLQTIEIPHSVIAIGSVALFSSPLTEFEIPEDLYYWGQIMVSPGATNSFKYVKCYHQNPIPNIDFAGTNNQDYWPTCPLYVPKGMVPVYRNVWPQWINARIVAATPVELESEWRTFCAVEDMDFSGVEGLEAYVATEYQDGKVLMEPIEQVPAGTGVVLRGAPGFYEIPYPEQDEALEPVDNLLVGLNYGERIQAETEDGQCNLFFNDATEMASLFYGPFMDSERAPRLNAEGEQPMFAPADGARLPYHRAYLQLPASEAGKTVDMVFGSFNGIEDVKAALPTDDNIYNLQGQRITNPGPGIYIQNGRKFVIR